MFNVLEKSINTKLDSIAESIMTKIDNMYNGMAFSTLDILQTFVLGYMCWCCFCKMMNRDKLSIPPFGSTTPMDGLFFNGMFYFILAVVKAGYDWRY